jgi:hypothetical protein
LKDIQNSDITGSKDSKWVAKVLKSHTLEEVHNKGYDAEARAEALNEFFRKNFRKLSKEQSLDFIKELST